MRSTSLRSSKWSLRWAGVRFVLASLVVILISSVGAPIGDAHGQRIRELESDTLRTPDKRGRVRVMIETEDDTTSSTIRIGSSRWRRQGDEESSLVRFGEDIVIDADEVIDGSVVSIGGNVIVRGRVLEDVVSVGGSIKLEDGAVVEGDAAAVGGGLDLAPDAEVMGEKFDVEFGPAVFTLGTPDGGRFFWAVFSLSLFLLLGLSALAVEWMFPTQMRRMTRHVRASLWPSFFVGLAAQVLIGPVLVILCITVIGIPAAILLPFVVTAAQIVGYVLVAAVLGAKFFDGNLDSRAAWIRGSLAGLAVLAFMTVIPLLLAGIGGGIGQFGRLLALGAIAANWTIDTLGMGAVLLSRFGSREPSVGSRVGPGDGFQEFPAGSSSPI
ncbi:MAG: hypothetical protein R3E97_04955 [Candidatus Eisenbacteria bacterium]